MEQTLAVPGEAEREHAMRELAREAYEAYRESLVGADPDHCSSMFHWGQLRPNQQQGWLKAIQVVLVKQDALA